MIEVSRRVLRVLIAEDDDEMRRLLAEEFTRHGWDAHEAADGADLLARLENGALFPSFSPDLIVSDEHMPRMRGLEVLQELAAEGLPCPFILITGFGDPALHAAAERLGATMTLDKPVDLKVLIEMANTIVAATQR